MVAEILKKTIFQSNWKQERLEDLYEQNNLDMNRYKTYDKYMQDKKKAINSLKTTNMNIFKSQKPIVRIQDKNRRENIHLQYHKFFVPKPGKACPDYLNFLAESLNPNENIAAILPPDQQEQYNPDDFLDNSDDWLPFTRGKSQKPETKKEEQLKSRRGSVASSVKSDVESPETFVPMNVPISIPVPVPSKKFESRSLKSSPLNSPTKKTPTLEHLTLFKIFSESGSARQVHTIEDKAGLGESTSKKSIHIPKLLLSPKFENPNTNQSSSMRNSLTLKTVRERLGLRAEPIHPVEDNLFSPIAIKMFAKNKSRASMLTDRVGMDVDNPMVTSPQKKRSVFSALHAINNNNLVQPSTQRKVNEDLQQQATVSSRIKDERSKSELKGFFPEICITSEKASTLATPLNFHQRSETSTQVRLSRFVQTARRNSEIKNEMLSPRVSITQIGQLGLEVKRNTSSSKGEALKVASKSSRVMKLKIPC